MKFRRIHLALASLLLSLSGCAKSGGSGSGLVDPYNRTYEKLDSSTLYVKKVENLDNGFMLGMDASSVLAEEASGVKYYDYDGKEADVFKVLSDSGINYIRVRIWNDPYDAEGHGYGGGNNDLAKAIAIGKRANQYQMQLLVDFHYSDFWADPSKQYAPKAWKSLTSISKKQTALYEYTKECLEAMKAENIKVGMVQVGNETNAKMSGETSWPNICKLMKSGSQAIREVYPESLVAVHFANPEKVDNYRTYAEKLNYWKVDYDVFGSSYYPYWHGTLDNLSSILSEIADKYSKKVAVLETSYCYTADNLDAWGNTVGESGWDTKDYPFTVAGQANSVRNIIDTVANKTKNGIGVCYWEGTWIAVGNNYDTNVPLWEEHGSGWATSYSVDYDPVDAGKYYGGCAVENQAMFGSDGKPLESLKVFNLVRFGNDAPKYVDGIEDAVELHYTDETFSLPTTVNAIYNDDSRVAIPVTWQAFDIEAAKAAGNGKYTIKGTASGYSVNCYLTIMEYNYIQNYSFEDGKGANWTMTNHGPATSESLKIQVTNENPQTGAYAFHFWGNDADSVNFDIEQSLNLPNPGTYKYQVSIMGGGKGSNAADKSKMNIYSYVKIDGEIVSKKTGYVTAYKEWSDLLISDIAVAAGKSVSVGVHIESSEAGIWGDIDDAMFNFVHA